MLNSRMLGGLHRGMKRKRRRRLGCSADASWTADHGRLGRGLLNAEAEKMASREEIWKQGIRGGAMNGVGFDGLEAWRKFGKDGNRG